jgi:hypothetical protein
VAASRPSIFLDSIDVVLTPSIQSEPMALVTEVDSGIAMLSRRSASPPVSPTPISAAD